MGAEKRGAVESAVSQIVGPDVVPILKLLKRKSTFSEVQLAKEAKYEINQVRNQLYRLYQHDLVSFTRKIDKEKKWYVYYWQFKPRRLKELVMSVNKETLQKLEERLKREKGTQFYMCSNGCSRVDFEAAADDHFKCPECGLLMEQHDNSRTIEEVGNRISQLNLAIRMSESPSSGVGMVAAQRVALKKKAKPSKRKTVKRKKK